METAQILFATLTGVFAGVIFGLVDAPIPAPPELAGIMGILGIYLGYRTVEYFDLVGDVASIVPF